MLAGRHSKLFCCRGTLQRALVPGVTKYSLAGSILQIEPKRFGSGYKTEPDWLCCTRARRIVPLHFLIKNR